MVAINSHKNASGNLIEWAGFINGVPVFADADGCIRIMDETGHVTESKIHDGLLSAVADTKNEALYCGGEDGKVSRVSSIGNIEIVMELGGKWIDHVAVSHNGEVVAAAGKTLFLSSSARGQTELHIERTVEGIAFAPKGSRIAIARFGGVELRWLASNSNPQFLEWQGAHTGVFFSPDGKSVISMMQENALHGWRLSDGRHMQMTGYPTKVKSWSWSKKAKWLATSGATSAILWPFTGKDGPMGKSPKELGSAGQNLVTCVSCHHQEEVVAIGYENGMITLVKIEDGQAVTLKPESNAAINTMRWHKEGNLLAYGGMEGEFGVIDIGAK